MTRLVSSLILLMLNLLFNFSLADQSTIDDEVCHVEPNHSKCQNDLNKVEESCFRAAVVEFSRVDLNESRASAESNLEAYRSIAATAAENGAKIIVFPEDGIFIGAKSYMRPMLTEIPDPESLEPLELTPCGHPETFQNELLRNLSCIAKENNLYVVANFGTKQNCKPDIQIGDLKCPKSGELILNTDVVLDSTGRFIKRYHKYNLFVEVFDRSPQLENVYFDTPFGRFGIFTCFDIIFRRPAIDLVEKYKIDTALFPTWWFDELPILSAVQFQDGWSWTNKINLLAANIHRLELGSTGSGIFSREEAITTRTGDERPKLIIATLPSLSDKLCDFKPQLIDLELRRPKREYKYKNFQLDSSDSLRVLDKLEDGFTLCNGKVCCRLDYSISESFKDSMRDKLLLIVRDGLRSGTFNWYEQICSLATIKTPIDFENLNKTDYSTKGLVQFERLRLEGTFNTKYVYPITAFSVSEIFPRKDREFDCETTTSGSTVCELNYASDKKPIYSFGMYGRVYENDNIQQK